MSIASARPKEISTQKTEEITFDCYGENLVVKETTSDIDGITLCPRCYAKRDTTSDNNTCYTLSKANCDEQQICEWN